MPAMNFSNDELHFMEAGQVGDKITARLPSWDPEGFHCCYWTFVPISDNVALALLNTADYRKLEHGRFICIEAGKVFVTHNTYGASHRDKRKGYWLISLATEHIGHGD